MKTGIISKVFVDFVKRCVNIPGIRVKLDRIPRTKFWVSEQNRGLFGHDLLAMQKFQPLSLSKP